VKSDHALYDTWVSLGFPVRPAHRPVVSAAAPATAVGGLVFVQLGQAVQWGWASAAQVFSAVAMCSGVL
jgi:hypothetical protein